MNRFTHEPHEHYTEEQYTNFGFLHGLKDIDIVAALVDSWFYLDSTHVGTMPLPANGMTADSRVGEYLCGIWQRFMQTILLVLATPLDHPAILLQTPDKTAVLLHA